MTIGFIGYGALGKQVHTLIQQNDPAVEAIFFDDVLYGQGVANSHPFGTFAEEQYDDLKFVIALGYKHFAIKQAIVRQLNDLGRQLFSFIHPTGFVNRLAVTGSGLVAYPKCNIDQEVKIGQAVLLNNSVTISHNSIIVDCCYLSPGVVLSGNVTVGQNTFIGTGALIANNVSIGNNVVIGIGTVVTKDIADNSFVIGNPMKLVNRLDVI